MGGSHCVRHCCKRGLRGAERSHCELGLPLLQPQLGAGMALQLRDGPAAQGWRRHTVVPSPLPVSFLTWGK